jgi:2-aminoadipate transaminase
VSPDDVIVTSGAQQAIALATQLVTKPGDAIGVDGSTYPAALDLFRTRGLRLVPLGEGTAQYLVPSIGNPSGRPLDPASRSAALRSTSWLIEDDAYAELRFDGRSAVPLLADRPGRVLHVGTFSKTLCPGLRVGWLVVPRRLRRRALDLKQADDLQSNSLAQAIVDEYLGRVDFEDYLRRLRVGYQRRADRLLSAIRRALPSWTIVPPEGGFSLWLETDARVDEDQFLSRAVREGVGFDLGRTFQAFADPSASTRLRVCYSSARPSTFEEGARRLARAWRRTSHRVSP